MRAARRRRLKRRRGHSLSSEPGAGLMTRLAEALRRAADPAEESPDSRGDASTAASKSTLLALSDRFVAQIDDRDGAASDKLSLQKDPSLGVFHRFSANVVDKLIITPTAPHAAVEQYRKLAASLHHAQLEKGIKVVMITSAAPGEGKTLTSTNLALTLSQSYRRNVLLIDGDLRRPSVHSVFDVPNVLGLNDGLKGEAEQKLSVIQVSEHLTVLPAGRPDSDPMSALTSDRMRRLVAEAAARFDWVLIDTPPVGFLSDANLLAAMADVTLFVIRAGRSPFRLIQRALDAVGRNRIIGVVLNAVKESDDVVGYGYYGYYGHYGPQRKLGARPGR
jgi:capsular exopolysaccharide synthesis family protein